MTQQQQQNVWHQLANLGRALNNAASQSTKKRKRGGRRAAKQECTPCAAQAYVDSLRGASGK